MTTNDEAPDFPPRTITIYWTDGDELEIRPGADLADWEVSAALARAVEVWDEVDEDADQPKDEGG